MLSSDCCGGCIGVYDASTDHSRLNVIRGLTSFQHPLENARDSITRNSTAAQHDPLIRVYDEAGNVIETHERKGDFKEP